jgi:membrane protease YdiL (CAAX protease family)
VIAGARELGTPGEAWAQPLALTLGMMALAARVPGMGAMVLVCLVGLIGVIAPAPPARSSPSPATWSVVTGLGMAVVYLVAGVGQVAAVPVNAIGVAASFVAAVAEEAFFRRFLYGWLAPRGPMMAIVGAALAFAAAHVPAYGPAVFPLNLAAGLLFGWQRWASGGWTAPAATHVLANLIGMGVLR